MQIIWLSPAHKSLNKIYNFYAEKNANAAINLYNKILEEIEILTQFPYIGQFESSLSYFNLYFRSLVVLKGRFKIIYEVEVNSVFIYTIWDCRRNPKTLIENIR